MAKNADKESLSEHPIEVIKRFSPSQLQFLKSRWMTTVDAFVAAAATEQGQKGLCKALIVKRETLDDLLHDARLVLGDTRYQELMEAKPGGPTGALWEEKEPHSIGE